MKGKPFWLDIQRLLTQEQYITLEQVLELGTGRVAEGMIMVGRSYRLSFISELPTMQDFDDSKHLKTPLFSVSFGKKERLDATSCFGYRYNEVVGPLSIAPTGGVSRTSKKNINAQAADYKRTMVLGPHYVAVYGVKTNKEEMLIDHIKISATKVIRLSFSMIHFLIARGLQGRDYQEKMLHKVLASIKARAEETGQWEVDECLIIEYREKLKKLEATSLGRKTKYKAYKELAREYNLRMLKRFDSTPTPTHTSTPASNATASTSKQTLSGCSKST